MFKRLAKFRHFEPRHLLPHRLAPEHSNDNQPGRRRPAGQCSSSGPALACHWSLVEATRLECRWNVDGFDERRPASSV
jgi:hypothetical protein